MITDLVRNDLFESFATLVRSRSMACACRNSTRTAFI